MKDFFIFIFIFMFSLKNYSKQIHISDLNHPSSTTEVSDTSSTKLNCRKNIEKIICLVEAYDNKNIKLNSQRPCIKGGRKYTHHFQTIYDNYPIVLQKMFCSLKVIYIEKDFLGTAHAGVLRGKHGQINGAEIGIRKSILDEQASLSLINSWKEQLSFGGIKDSYTLTPSLPHVETSSNNKINDFLYFVITHEFAHLFDFTNSLNKYNNCSSDHLKWSPEVACILSENSWGSMSWISNIIPKLKNEFTYRLFICFYWCEDQPLEKETISQVYSDWYKTDFISTYATSYPEEDFADSLAFFVLSKYLKYEYVIDTKQNARYDIMKKLHSPIFAKKYDYLKKFLNRTDILYP